MTETTTPPRSKPRWRRLVGSTWFHVAAAFVVTGLILSFVAKPYWVPSGSMETTLQPGDRVMVNRLAYLGASPGNGDIIVFDAGSTWDIEASPDSNPIKRVLRWVGEVTGFGPSSAHTLIKRVIGTPGQSVECCSADGRLMIDGEPIDEPYVTNDFSVRSRRVRLHHHSPINAVLRRGRGARRLVPDARRQPWQLVGLRRVLPKRHPDGRLLAVGRPARYRRQCSRAVLAHHTVERAVRPCVY